MPTPWIDIAIAVVGACLLIFVAIRHFAFGKRELLFDLAQRPNKLWPELIVIPMIAFLVCMTGAPLFLSHDATAEMRPEIIIPLHTFAQFAGGAVCVLLGSLTFERGISGFLVGDKKLGGSVVWGAAGLLAAYPLCWSALALSTWIMLAGDPQQELPTHPVIEAMQAHDLPGWMPGFLWVATVLIAPFAEEVFFRGVCQTGLNHLFKRPMLSVLIMSVVFGAMHYSQPQVVAPLIILGFFLGYVYERTGSLLAPFALHLLFNLRTMIEITLIQQQA